MSTSQHLQNGLPNDPQNITTAVKKPLTESPGDDVSMLIETVTGKQINVTKPDATAICLEDIAWALSRIARFAGHTITEIPYNVAQHSVYVSQLAEELLTLPPNVPSDMSLTVLGVQEAIAATVLDKSDLLLHALLHDGHEAYMGDMPSPIKKIPELHETIKLIESRLDHAIFTKFQLPEVDPYVKKFINYCDKLAQAIEVYQFMPSRGKHWELPKPSLLALHKFPQPKTAISSYEDFMFRFEYLRSL